VAVVDAANTRIPRYTSEDLGVDLDEYKKCFSSYLVGLGVVDGVIMVELMHSTLRVLSGTNQQNLKLEVILSRQLGMR
jgi:hypothetical protein